MLAAALAIAGCGNERAVPPDTATPQDPIGTKLTILDAAGVRFTSPANWPDLGRQGRRAGGVQSRSATVAVWRYPRTEPLPEDPAALRRVRDLLVDRVEQRDPTFALRSARLVRRGGADGIELLGRQTIAGRRVGVRSSHLFTRGGEVVVDAYAPPASFDRLDASVFRPLLRSLRRSKLKVAR
jgi:hypothetical protein